MGKIKEEGFQYRFCGIGVNAHHGSHAIKLFAVAWMLNSWGEGGMHFGVHKIACDRYAT